MSSFPFTKMHHCGNDYIYIDFLEQGTTEKLLHLLDLDHNSPHDLNFCYEKTIFSSPQFLEWVTQVSHRRFGIGADGVICLVPLAEASTTRNIQKVKSSADVKMKMFNADASVSAMCGNGLISLAGLYCLHGHSLNRQSGNNSEKINGNDKIITSKVRIATDESEKTGLYSVAVVEMVLKYVQESNTFSAPLELKSVEIKIIQEPILDAERIPCIFHDENQNIASSKEHHHPLLKSHVLKQAPIFFHLEVTEKQDESLFAVLSQEKYRKSLKNTSEDDEKEEVVANGKTIRFPVYCVGMGNPHATVVFSIPPSSIMNENTRTPEITRECIRQEYVKDFPLEEIAKKIIQYSSSCSTKELFFPQGVNVSLVFVFDEKIDEKNSQLLTFSMLQRTFERGSGETLACGSGSCASVVASSYHILQDVNFRNKNINRVDAKVFPPGGETRVRFSKEEGVLLSGIPKVSFRGEL